MSATDRSAVAEPLPEPVRAAPSCPASRTCLARPPARARRLGRPPLPARARRSGRGAGGCTTRARALARSPGAGRAGVRRDARRPATAVGVHYVHHDPGGRPYANPAEMSSGSSRGPPRASASRSCPPSTPTASANRPSRTSGGSCTASTPTRAGRRGAHRPRALRRGGHRLQPARRRCRRAAGAGVPTGPSTSTSGAGRGGRAAPSGNAGSLLLDAVGGPRWTLVHATHTDDGSGPMIGAGVVAGLCLTERTRRRALRPSVRPHRRSGASARLEPHRPAERAPPGQYANGAWRRDVIGGRRLAARIESALAAARRRSPGRSAIAPASADLVEWTPPTGVAGQATDGARRLIFGARWRRPQRHGRGRCDPRRTPRGRSRSSTRSAPR